MSPDSDVLFSALNKAVINFDEAEMCDVKLLSPHQAMFYGFPPWSRGGMISESCGTNDCTCIIDDRSQG